MFWDLLNFEIVLGMFFHVCSWHGELLRCLDYLNILLIFWFWSNYHLLPNRFLNFLRLLLLTRLNLSLELFAEIPHSNIIVFLLALQNLFLHHLNFVSQLSWSPFLLLLCRALSRFFILKRLEFVVTRHRDTSEANIVLFLATLCSLLTRAWGFETAFQSLLS